MKRQYFLYFILASVILITGIMISCKKDKQKITINGSVYSPNLQSYVANAHVTISASMVTSGFYNSNYTDIASTTTDGSGAFTFEFDKMKSAGYRIYISKDNYFDNTIDVADADIVAGTPYTPSYNLYPVAFIKLHVKNTTPNDSTDFISYYYSTTGLPSCFECCSNTIFKGYGTAYDTIIKCKTYGNQYMKISGHFFQMWTAAISDSVYCVPFDTTSHNLFY